MSESERLEIPFHDGKADIDALEESLGAIGAPYAGRLLRTIEEFRKQRDGQYSDSEEAIQALVGFVDKSLREIAIAVARLELANGSDAEPRDISVYFTEK